MNPCGRFGLTYRCFNVVYFYACVLIAIRGTLDTTQFVIINMCLFYWHRFFDMTLEKATKLQNYIAHEDDELDVDLHCLWLISISLKKVIFWFQTHVKQGQSKMCTCSSFFCVVRNQMLL